MLAIGLLQSARCRRLRECFEPCTPHRDRAATLRFALHAADGCIRRVGRSARRADHAWMRRLLARSFLLPYREFSGSNGRNAESDASVST